MADRQIQALHPKAHSSAVTALALSADGKILATGGADRELKLWDVDSQLHPRPFAGIEAKVRSLALTADGKILATAMSDGTVQFWDARSGKVARRSSQVQRDRESASHSRRTARCWPRFRSARA